MEGPSPCSAEKSPFCTAPGGLRCSQSEDLVTLGHCPSAGASEAQLGLRAVFVTESASWDTAQQSPPGKLQKGRKVIIWGSQVYRA